MKLDQIAYYAHTNEQANQISDMFGLGKTDWVHDFVEGKITLPKYSGSLVHESTANLAFNYELGIEFEILTYASGPHWHLPNPSFAAGDIFISHVGFHCEPEDVAPLSLAENGFELVQVMDTTKHTNPYLVEKGRRYHYEIYSHSTLPLPDQKYIWRIEE